MTDHKPLPVPGYVAQSDANVASVKQNKEMEEVLLRRLDALKTDATADQRWLAIGRTHIEEGFMAINRSIFKPQRAKLPTD